MYVDGAPVGTEEDVDAATEGEGAEDEVVDSVLLLDGSLISPCAAALGSSGQHASEGSLGGTFHRRCPSSSSRLALLVKND